MTGNHDSSTLEYLLARAGRMRSLARALCPDPAGADDLVQDAFVAAVERPPVAAQSPSAWIARVISNLSTDRARAESARRERERSASRAEALPSADELVVRAEMQRRLVERVLAVPEPYRSTLLERWFEERTPEEIARRLRIPSSTVRTRLSRGMALLRERLEREEGGSWMAGMAALAWGSRPASAAAPSVLSGGLLVSTGAKVVVGIAALAAVSWIAWPRLEEQATPVQVAEAATTPLEPGPSVEPNGGERLAVEATGETSPASGVSTEVTLGEPTEAECARMEEPVPASTIAGIVLRGREPQARGTAYLRRGVRLVPQDPEEAWLGVPSMHPTPGEEKLWKCRLGPDGRFAFDGLPQDWYTLAIDVGRGTCRQMKLSLIRGGRAGRTIVIVLGTAEIAGHVYDDDGKPIEGARVCATLAVERNREWRAFEAVRWTDDRGAYTLGELPAGTYEMGMRRDGKTSEPQWDETLEATLPVGGRRVVDFGRHRRMPVWHGVLRARTGEPVHGAGRIHLEGVGDGRKLDTFYDLAGAFRVALLPGRYVARVAAVGDPQRMVELGTVDVPERGMKRDLVLPGTRLRGIAIDAATGRTWAIRMEQSISLRPQGTDHPAAIHSAPVEPDGTFVFDGLEPGVWVVSAFPRELHGVADGRVEVTVLPNEEEVPLTVTIGTGGR
jgi:RNA polymerase sigma factor (sigma-70 family)